MPGRKYTSADGYRYGFNGMENDDEVNKGSGNSIDFGARMYDPRIGRWFAVDPLAAKFPAYTPYSFVNNMPIWALDPDGRDIIVLSYGTRKNRKNRGVISRHGHQAILIGDDENGWTYYSKDTDTGPVEQQHTIKDFKTFKEFARSEFNTMKDDYHDGKGFESSKRSEDGTLVQRYGEAYLIKTTEDKIDKKMHVAAKKEVIRKWENWTNCTHVCEDALDAGGFEDGESGWLYTPNFYPQSKQESIEENNEGVDKDEVLKEIKQIQPEEKKEKK